MVTALATPMILPWYCGDCHCSRCGLSHYYCCPFLHQCACNHCYGTAPACIKQRLGSEKELRIENEEAPCELILKIFKFRSSGYLLYFSLARNHKIEFSKWLSFPQQHRQTFHVNELGSTRTEKGPCQDWNQTWDPLGRECMPLGHSARPSAVTAALDPECGCLYLAVEPTQSETLNPKP